MILRAALLIALCALAPAAARATPMDPLPEQIVTAKWKVDQIRFATPADIKTLDVLTPDHSMDAVADHLQRLGITFKRATTEMTVRLASSVIARLKALPPGEPWIVPNGDDIVVSNILVWESGA